MQASRFKFETKMRYTAAGHDAMARDFKRDGLIMLHTHFLRDTLVRWAQAFPPMLAAEVEREKDNHSRGAQRYCVMLPFEGMCADPAIHADPDVLAIVERVAGPEPVLCQLVSDTPLKSGGRGRRSAAAG